MIGDLHPEFPLLHVVDENADGHPVAYGTKGPWFSLRDPRLILTDRTGRSLLLVPFRRTPVSEMCMN